MAGKTKKRQQIRKRAKTPKYANQNYGQSYVCNVCNKQFRQESSFEMHRLIHKDEHMFSCDICKKEFPFLSRLQKHCLLEHSKNLLQEEDEEKRYQCRLCDRDYSLQNSLFRHILRVHGGKYPYSKELSYRSLITTNDPNRSDLEDYSSVHRQTAANGRIDLNPSYDFSANGGNISLNGDEQSLNIMNDSTYNSGFIPKCDSVKVGERNNGEPSANDESDASCDESIDPGQMCAVLWDEGPSSNDKGNHTVQDFSKNSLCPMTPGEVAELCMKPVPFNFDTQADSVYTEEVYNVSWFDGSADGRNNMSLPVKRKAQTKNKSRPIKRGKRATSQKKRRALERSQKMLAKEEVSEFPEKTENTSLETRAPTSTSRKGIKNRNVPRKRGKRSIAKRKADQKRKAEKEALMGMLANPCPEDQAEIPESSEKTENTSLETEVPDVSENQFGCDICDRKFTLKCHLQNHIRTHEPQTADQPTSDQLSNALDASNIRPYTCKTCHERFVKIEDYHQHCLIHVSRTMHTCKVCSEQFTHYINFLAHCDTHVKKDTFDCTKCGTTFHLQKHLIDHEKTQYEDNLLKCKFCTMGFDHGCSLISHEQSHSGYRCEDCGSECSGTEDLVRHRRSHASAIKCGVCSKSFATNDLLRDHLDTYVGPKMYRCGVCDEEFEFEHDSIMHRTTHRDDRPHMCQLCNKGFLHASLLRNHLMKHDAETPQDRSVDNHAENMELSASCEEKLVETS